jgi:hypothetical protein
MRQRLAVSVLAGLLLLGGGGGGSVAARRKERPPISGVGNSDGDPNKASGEAAGAGGGGAGLLSGRGLNFGFLVDSTQLEGGGVRGWILSLHLFSPTVCRLQATGYCLDIRPAMPANSRQGN